MNYRQLSDNDLADFAGNVVTLLGGAELASINEDLKTELVAAFGTKPNDLDKQTVDAMAAEGQRMAVVSEKNMTRQQLLEILSRVKNALAAGVASKSEYDLCGFDFQAYTGGRYSAVQPTELSAFGYSNGITRVKYRGNNKVGMVVYEIWRREGDEGEWALLAATKKQTFDDVPVVPGRYYEYKVRAVAASSVSGFSNSSVVYGA